MNMLLMRVFFTALLVGSCTTAQPTQTAAPWRIEVGTSGGLTGRGNGDLTVDSSGAMTVTRIDGKSCRSTLSAAELRPLADAVATARPAEWQVSYIPENRCCDRIEWVLTLEPGRTTRWIDDPLPLPRDLAAIDAALLELRQTHQCE